MPETLLPELRDLETRKALSEAVLAAMGRWGLPEDKQSELLGVAEIAELKQGEALPDVFDVLERAGHLLAIDRALVRLYPNNDMMRNNWLLFTYSELGGVSALAHMLSGLDGIKCVRTLIESQLKAGD